MGRGRKSIIVQGNSKKKKECGPLPKQERNAFCLASKNPAKQTTVYLPEEVLNELRQMNPRDVVNIIAN